MRRPRSDATFGEISASNIRLRLGAGQGRFTRRRKKMRTRTSIGILVLVFSVSTVMLATQRGQGGGQTPAVGASSATGSAQDHRHNPTVTSDHKADTAGQKDSNGFKNYGQYVAAAQVSKHLNIPLAD